MALNLHHFNRQHALVKPGDRILVGVSGGPDSMALLHWLTRMRASLNLTLFAIHVNHSLRGKEADEDQAYVEEMCRQWEVPCRSVVVNVARYKEEHGLSKQTAARVCRYKSYAAVAKEQGLTKLALAHHADDQVETMLMRLVRGSGRQGLSGIPLQRQWNGLTIIRPLLNVTKMEIEQYCHENDINPRLDLTNFEDHDTRNYLRLHVIPQLKKLNPNLHRTMLETAELLEAEHHYLEAQAQDLLEQVASTAGAGRWEVDLPSFQRVPLPLQRRVILLILNCLLKSEEEHISWNKVHIDQILQLSSTHAGHKRLSLPGETTILREYDKLLFIRAAVPQPEQQNKPSGASLALQLPTAGETTYRTENGVYRFLIRGEDDETWQPILDEGPKSGQSNSAADRQYGSDWVARFDADQLHFPLTVRCRQAGDKLQPLGMAGHKKLKDLFIDRKIPLSQRDGWPLLTDQQGILWVPGLQRAERGKLTAASRSVLTIEVRYLREGNQT